MRKWLEKTALLQGGMSYFSSCCLREDVPQRLIVWSGITWGEPESWFKKNCNLIFTKPFSVAGKCLPVWHSVRPQRKWLPSTLYKTIINPNVFQYIFLPSLLLGYDNCCILDDLDLMQNCRTDNSPSMQHSIQFMYAFIYEWLGRQSWVKTNFYAQDCVMKN